MDAVVKEEETGIEVKIEEEDDYQDVIPYEYRDYKRQHDIELQSVDTKKRKIEKTPEKDVLECRKCGRWIASHRTKPHARTHTNLCRFECGAKLCGFGSWQRAPAVKHVEKRHGGNLKYIRENKLTEEETDELEKVIDECFPGFGAILPQIPYPQQNRNYMKPTSSQEQHYPYLNYMDYYTTEQKPSSSQGSCSTNAIRKPSTQNYKLVALNTSALAQYYKKKETMIGPKKEVENSAGFERPNVELIDVKQENEEEYQDAIPYEYRDYYQQQNAELQPVDTNKKKVKTARSEKEKIECQKCKKWLAPDRRKDHATDHANLFRFECAVKSCGFSFWYRSLAVEHVKKRHSGNSTQIREKRLTEDEKDKLEEMIEECFPGYGAILPPLTYQPSNPYQKYYITEQNQSSSQESCSTNAFRKLSPQCYKRVVLNSSALAQNHKKKVVVDEAKKAAENSLKLKEPKVESIGEEDVHIMEEIDDAEYQHMIPYEYRDYSGQSGTNNVTSKKSSRTN